MIIKARTKKLIEQALKEDIDTGDITTSSVVQKSQQGKFIIVSNESCVVCGMVLAESCFYTLDKDVYFRPMVKDGTRIQKGKVLAHIQGRCYGVLLAERTALNFLGWLSGISTLTDKFVNAVKAYRVQIMDTRKTIPTMRFLQKYAVRIGGGKNHRMGLYDQILIKDNHLSVTSHQSPVASKNSIRYTIEKVRKYGPKNKRIEIEAKGLTEFKQALVLNPDIIMLDNMKITNIKETVRLRDSHRIKQQSMSGDKTLLEVSGNVNLNNVAEIASCGVDRISIGALTHSAPAIDFSLKAE